MAHETKLGMNRTGMDMSPLDSKETPQGSQRSPPTNEGDESALAALRAEYIVKPMRTSRSSGKPSKSSGRTPRR
jgi:hypothetical protein